MSNYKELAAFNKQVERIDGMLATLKKEKAALSTELISIQRERQQLIVNEAVNGQAIDDKILAKLTKKDSELKDRIAEYEERISAIENNRRDVLSKEVDSLRKGYLREVDKLEKAALAKTNDIVKMAAEYLLTLQEVGKLRQEAQALHNDFHDLVKDVTDDYSGERNRFNFPKIDLFNSYEGKYQGVREYDQLQALNGYVPPNVSQYQLTGEIEYIVGLQREAVK